MAQEVSFDYVVDAGRVSCWVEGNYKVIKS